MSELADSAARAVSRCVGRAVAIRRTYALSPDPARVFGIAPVRVVSEQRVQAIAYGTLDVAPTVVTMWNPLSRDTGELEPFSDALHAYITAALAMDRLPRIWIPHTPALEILDVVGHRYRTNRQATDSMRRLGAYCHAYVEESKYAGQQGVAIASDLLAAHVVTGQSPVEDRHLGSLLAWFEGLPGTDVVDEARRRALLPAAAMLDRPADDEVEALRKVAKRGRGHAAAAARTRIDGLLRLGARREWALLKRAREAFWGFGLEDGATGRLEETSRRRLSFSLLNYRNPPSRPHALARLLDQYEQAREEARYQELRGDRTARDRAREKGRVIESVVTAVNQPRRGRRPCTITVRTRQPVLRVRRGTRLQNEAGNIDARVVGVRDGRKGATLVELRVERGVRSTPPVGAAIEWLDIVPFRATRRKNEIYRTVLAAAHPVVFGGELPAPRPRDVAVPDLLAEADAARRST